MILERMSELNPKALKADGFDDAIYAGARLCELLSKRNKSIDSIFTNTDI